MGKNKLRRFAEINSFTNVIQPQSKHTLSPFQYKGCWGSDFFYNDHPIILEIGCGKGEYTIGLAKAFPGKNFIGIDIKGDRIWKGARQALDEGLHNAAFLRIQAEHIEQFFGEGEVSGIWLTFPDPQSKKVRAKKRLTSPGFLEKYRKILAPDSPIHLKTDNTGLFRYTLDLIGELGLFLREHSFDLYADEHVREEYVKSIQTYYELKFLKEGRPIHYLQFSLHEPTQG